MNDLIRAQLDQQDRVDNAIHALLNQLRPEGTSELPWQQAEIAYVREAVLHVLHQHFPDANLYPALGDPLPDELYAEFLDLASQLEPENLTCDGELDATLVEQRRRRLLRKWHVLERKVGRRVTQEEVWQWHVQSLRSIPEDAHLEQDYELRVSGGVEPSDWEVYP